MILRHLKINEFKCHRVDLDFQIWLSIRLTEYEAAIRLHFWCHTFIGNVIKFVKGVTVFENVGDYR